MGGSNPYFKPPAYRLPTRTYRIRFLPQDIVVEVDPAKIPYGPTGLPGSILATALAHGISLEHACGGVCACSTCHVVVREGIESCCEQTEEECDELEMAPALTPQSRLGCQCVPDGSMDLVVEIPAWNRNLAKEEE
ncbi:MAG: 2Fe-2S iron-sulfur cluster binding domain-containing protein [Planctomycetes bacterium]|nr:2Fe-2S iron-sulfur cluster binding domain-containing protein [Planctomycetota bacterium]